MTIAVDRVPQRFPAERPLEEDLGAWVLVYVKPRQEKALALDLMDAGVPYYLPMLLKCRRRPESGRLAKTLIPLFPSYVAAAAPPHHRTALYHTTRVVRLFRVKDQERFVRDLEAVQKMLACGFPVTLRGECGRGSLVRIGRGPLLGLTGLVQQIHNRCRFTIGLDMFHRTLSVNLPAEDLQVLA